MYWRIFFKPRLLTIGPAFLLTLLLIAIESFPKLFGLSRNEFNRVLFTSPLENTILIGIIVLVYLFSCAIYYSAITYMAFVIKKRNINPSSIHRFKKKEKNQ